MGSVNAIDYIKKRDFYKESKYKWLRPLIDSVLDEDEILTKDDVEEFLQMKLSLISEPVIAEKEPGKASESKEEEEEEEEEIQIKRIKSINNLSNVGLVEIGKPIDFKDKLNIIYGKNGSGKSSIFSALCTILGFEKKVLCNLSKEDEPSECSVTVILKDGKSLDLEWNSESQKIKTDVKVFDNEISKLLVDKDQINKFEISHLKTEKFFLLQEMYKIVTDYIQGKMEAIEQKKGNFEELISEKMLDFFEVLKNPTKEIIEKFTFEDKDKTSLTEINTKIKSLESDETESVIRNLETDKNFINSVLRNLQSFEFETDQKEQKSEVSILDKTSVTDKNIEEICKEYELLQFRYTEEAIEEINNKIDRLAKGQKSFEKSGAIKLTDLVPEDWFRKEEWKTFIRKSIEFIESLEDEQKQKYLNEVCLYCQQPLRESSSRELIKLYQVLKKEYEEDIKNSEDKIKKITLELELNLEELGEAFGQIETIKVDLKKIGKDKIEEFESDKVISFIKRLIGSLENLELIKTNKEELKYLESFWKSLIESNIFLTGHIGTLKNSLNNKKKNINDLKSNLKPLELKKIVVENRDSIMEYLDFCLDLEKLKEKKNDLSMLKQIASRNATSFSEKYPLEEFKKILNDEYKDLGFHPPEYWNISASTSGQTNKRVYSLKDKRVSEIFSEGEKKVHALADFFAECELNGFSGVFIFDDPVSSLDEERMEAVKDRILALCEQGNQVLVFTHNLVFLNLLVDTAKEGITNLERLERKILIERDIILGGTENKLKKRLTKIGERIKLLSKREEDEIDLLDIQNVYDLISGYLEDFVEVIIFKDVINRYRTNIRMNSLDRLEETDFDEIKEVFDFYKRISRKCSRHSHPPGTPEPKLSELEGHFEELCECFNYKR